MKPGPMAFLVILAALAALPTASAIVRDVTFDVELAPGSSYLIPYQARWDRGIAFEFEVEDDDVMADVYIVLYAWNASAREPTVMEGDVLSASILLASFENITRIDAAWDAPDGWEDPAVKGVTIVVDNVDGPSAHDADSTRAVTGELVVRWNEDQPVDFFMTVFCCGVLVAFVIVLMWVFVRFLFRKPPRVAVESGDGTCEAPAERSPTTARRNPPRGGGRGQEPPPGGSGGRPLPPPPDDIVPKAGAGGGDHDGIAAKRPPDAERERPEGGSPPERPT